MYVDSGVDGFPIACVGGGTPGEVFCAETTGARYNAPVFGRRFLSSSERSRQLVPRDPEFHDNLEFWRWIVEAGMNVSEGGLSAPMYRLVARPPCHTLTSDASKHAVGGSCLET